MKKIFLFIIIASSFAACHKEYIPKPRGYFRITFPEKSYHNISDGLPYQFAIPDYSQLEMDREKDAEEYWRNILIPGNNSEIHISYKNVTNNLATFTEESRSLAYQHSIKADAIDEQIYVNPVNRVFGTIYYIDGNAASPIQFYLTDSTQHFLRGALYINEVPNIDSVRPVINFLRPDIIHLIETTRWK